MRTQQPEPRSCASSSRPTKAQKLFVIGFGGVTHIFQGLVIERFIRRRQETARRSQGSQVGAQQEVDRRIS